MSPRILAVSAFLTLCSACGAGFSGSSVEALGRLARQWENAAMLQAESVRGLETRLVLLRRLADIEDASPEACARLRRGLDTLTALEEPHALSRSLAELGSRMARLLRALGGIAADEHAAGEGSAP